MKAWILAAAVVVMAAVVCGCAFHYKAVIVEMRTPGPISMGDIRNENLSEGITADVSARASAVDSVNTKGVSK